MPNTVPANPLLATTIAGPPRAASCFGHGNPYGPAGRHTGAHRQPLLATVYAGNDAAAQP
ncbi:MAG: hypothetical protein R3E79_01050 [Caldilineaceae bacterium]